MARSKKNIIAADEAKTHFFEVLRRVAGGEQMTITRHGVPVARMMPVRSKAPFEQRRDAVREIRRLAKHNSLRGLRIKDLVAEGRW